jgi:hypothetical protein
MCQYVNGRHRQDACPFRRDSIRMCARIFVDPVRERIEIAAKHRRLGVVPVARPLRDVVHQDPAVRGELPPVELQDQVRVAVRLRVTESTERRRLVRCRDVRGTKAIPQDLCPGRRRCLRLRRPSGRDDQRRADEDDDTQTPTRRFRRSPPTVLMSRS